MQRLGICSGSIEFRLEMEVIKKMGIINALFCVIRTSFVVSVDLNVKSRSLEAKWYKPAAL